MNTTYFLLSTVIICSNLSQGTDAFQSFKLPNLFQLNGPQQQNTAGGVSRPELEKRLLEAVSNTQNGKSATPSQQKQVLKLVSNIESIYPSPALSEVVESGIIDGTWFLQYTSPSELQDIKSEVGSVDDEEGEASTWKVENAEGNITTQKYNAKGSVSAGGINVDVSKQPPKQIFDLSKSTVFNEVQLDKGMVRVGGTFRVSDNKDNRAVVSFKECNINLNFGLKLDLGFLFMIRTAIMGTDENGWLETTYISDRMRIGRGNKGSMFVLTRDEKDVTP